MVFESLPPMNYLRPFEATARLGSMNQAAKELGRSHSNIFRYIRLLEEFIGESLFQKKEGSLILTQEGATLYRVVSESLFNISTATDSVKNQRNDNHLIISAPAIFASRWLLPRLNRFQLAHPLVNFELLLERQTTTTSIRRYDFRLSLCRVKFDFVDSVSIMHDEIIVVAAPNLLAAAQQTDNDAFQLIETIDVAANWLDWYETLPFLQSAKISKLSIPDADVAVSAACAGLGLLITRKALVQDLLTAGQLQMVTDHSIHLDTAYWLSRSEVIAERQIDIEFKRWLLVETVQSANSHLGSAWKLSA